MSQRGSRGSRGSRWSRGSYGSDLCQENRTESLHLGIGSSLQSNGRKSLTNTFEFDSYDLFGGETGPCWFLVGQIRTYFEGNVGCVSLAGLLNLNEQQESLMNRFVKALRVKGRMTEFMDIVTKKDETKSCKINCNQLKTAMRQLYEKITSKQNEEIELSSDELEKIFKMVTVNSHIPINDFLVLVRGPMNEERHFYINCAFNKLDANKDGYIDMKEAASFYSSQGMPEILLGEVKPTEAAKKLIQKFDLQQSGIIAFTDFYEICWCLSVKCKDDADFAEEMKTMWWLNDIEMESFRNTWVPPQAFPQVLL